MLTSCYLKGGIRCDDQNHPASAAINFWSKLLRLAALSCILSSSGANARGATLGTHASKTIQITVSVAPPLRLQSIIGAAPSDTSPSTSLCYGGAVRPLEASGSRSNALGAILLSIGQVGDNLTTASRSWLSYSALSLRDWRSATNGDASDECLEFGEARKPASLSRSRSSEHPAAASDRAMVLIVPD